MLNTKFRVIIQRILKPKPMSMDDIRERLVRVETKVENIEKMIERTFPTFVKLSRFLPVEKIALGLAGTALIFIVKIILETVVAK